MAFVNIPKDLNVVKTKIALNLTKRQLICFAIAGVIGIPLYIFTRGTIGNSAATLLMMTAMLPLFFMGIYEKDGQPAEKILRNIIRARILWPGKRPYKTENMYAILEKKERINFDKQAKATTKTTVAKRKSSKGKPRKHK